MADGQVQTDSQGLAEVPARADVVVVGAGFSGIYLVHLLRGRGFDVVVLEAGSGVGGTWYWNRYPGARCDVESVQYSDKYLPELEQEWTWTERYAAQPEILRYAQFVADKHGLRRDIRFSTRVTSAEWDDADYEAAVQALRENGLDVTQLGGADCPLIPVRFGGPQMPYCDTLLERIVAEVSETTYDALLLSTRYSPREVEEDYVLAILEFWSTLETDVYLFSPMPERHNFDRIFSRNPSQAIGMPGDDSHASKFYAALEDVDLPGNIQVVDTEELFCSMAPDCASAIGLHPLLIDYGHLSVLGARLFGRELIERLDILHRADE